MKLNFKLSGALIVSTLLHVIVGVVGFFFWLNTASVPHQDSIGAVLIKVDRPKLERKLRPKRAQIRKSTLNETNQPRLKVLTSNTPVTERGVFTAEEPAKFSAVEFLQFSDGAALDTNGIRLDESALQIGRVIENPIVRGSKQEVRPKSRLVKFVENQEGPQAIAYCIDLSSSMLSLSPRKLKKIISIMQNSLTFLEAHDRFNIVTFSDETAFFQPHFVDSTEQVILQGASYFAAASPRKTTGYMEKDMLKALAEVAKMDPTIIVIFSDGILTSGVPNPKEIRRTAAASPRVFAMGIEMAEDFPGAVLLDMLAHYSDGEFWLVD